MDLSDALTITGLGMAVVFSGLLLTAGLITALGRLEQIFDAPPVPDEAPKPAISAGAAIGPPIDPEVLTVITTVLEVERRLHRVGRSRTGETADE
jgi:Na+-transporting methylmalonyl-CoA/oxaloacetate decarboxylase gamma subunit